jgi:hypothetical protein
LVKESLISVKELASKLAQTDALLKKLIRDFSISSSRIKKRIHLSEDAVQIIKTIIDLKEKGNKNKDIEKIIKEDERYLRVKINSSEPKEFSDEDQEEEGLKENLEESSDELIEEKNPDEDQASEEKKALPKKKNKSRYKKDKKPYTTEESNKESDNLLSEQFATESDFSQYLSENIDNTQIEDFQKEIDEALKSTEDDESTEEEPFVVQEEQDSSTSEKRVRRRRFNFRYIQRQIANDSRKVNYIKNKLRKSRLSTLERVNLQDTLDKRSKMLNGWIHLLRWVKS